MVLVTILFTAWFLLLVVLLTGWRNAMKAIPPQAGGREPLISVVVAARNESANIGRLLDSLAAQQYSHFEVIVVDDGSDDETVAVARRHSLKGLQVAASKGSGKKAAISTGIAMARGSLIVTTDADCVVPSEWLHRMRAPFREKSVMLAFGGVKMDGDSFFASLQAIEFASLIGSGAATAALGVPTMCNGANLAFRRNAFTAVKGYQGNTHIPTGDDEFLLRKISKRYPGSVRFVNSPLAVVTTQTSPTLGEFFHQRVRWASKWRFNTWPARSLAVGILGLQIAVLMNFALLFTPVVLSSLFLIAVKMILEASLLLQVCRFLGARWRWRAFLALQLLYPVYVIAVAVNALFASYSWKNRTFEPV